MLLDVFGASPGLAASMAFPLAVSLGGWLTSRAGLDEMEEAAGPTNGAADCWAARHGLQAYPQGEVGTGTAWTNNVPVNSSSTSATISDA